MSLCLLKFLLSCFWSAANKSTGPRIMGTTSEEGNNSSSINCRELSYNSPYPWAFETSPVEAVNSTCDLIMDGVTGHVNESMIMFEEGVTVLNVLSISAIITTVSLFFCGIPICIKIWKQQGVGDISGMPFVTGVLGGVFWLRYGLLKFDLTMVVVNVVGVSLMSSYLTFYYIYSPTKKWITVQIMVICVLMSSMLVTVEFYGRSVIHPLGFVCMTFNILNFGSPLAGLGTVVRQKCTSSLPLPLCLATFLVSCQWCLYGTLVSDVYIITPNGIGMILAVTQLTLFVIYPSTQGGTSLLKMLCGCCFGVSNEDAENRHQSGRKSTRFFCRRRPKAAATDKPHKSSIFGRRSVVSVDLSNSLLLSKATLGPTGEDKSTTLLIKCPH